MAQVAGSLATGEGGPSMQAHLDRLLSQNKQLQATLDTRDKEVAALRDIAAAHQEVGSTDGHADKVAELAKKNRSLNLTLERERQKVAKLEQSLSQASASKDGGVVQKVQQAARTVVAEAADAAESASKEVAVLKERLAVMTNRMGQMEQKAYLLELENRKALRALVKEVGEEVPLSKVLEEGTDWKGRREQVIALKDQLRRLKEEQGRASPNRHDMNHRTTISKANKERNAEVERVQAELVEARQLLEKQRMQWQGAVSRRKVMEDEAASLRQKLQIVLKKTANDDSLITALRNELALISAAGRGGEDSVEQAKAAWHELTELRQRCLELEEQVDRQQKIIVYLQAKGLGAGGAISARSTVQSYGPSYLNSAGSQGVSLGVSHMEELTDQMEALQDENEDLRAQVTLLRDDLQAMQRPGTTGRSEELRQQVVALQEENRELRSELGSSQQQSHMGRLSLGSGGGGAASSRRGSTSSVTGAPPAGSHASSQAGSMAGSRRQTDASRVQSGRQQVARGASLLQRVSARDDGQPEALAPPQLRGGLAQGEADDLVDELGFGDEPEPEEGVGYFDEQQEDDDGERYETGPGAEDDCGGQPEGEMRGRQSGDEQGAW